MLPTLIRARLCSVTPFPLVYVLRSNVNPFKKINYVHTYCKIYFAINKELCHVQI